MNQQLPDQQTLHTIFAAYAIFFVVFFVIKVVLYTIPMWRIAKRAGLSPQLALMCAIPFVGRLITTYVIAFSDWRVTPVNDAYAFPPPVAQPPTPYAPPYTTPPTQL